MDETWYPSRIGNLSPSEEHETLFILNILRAQLSFP